MANHYIVKDTQWFESPYSRDMDWSNHYIVRTPVS